MKKFISIILIVCISAISIESFAQGYEIKIKIPKLPNQKVILGYRFNAQLFPSDTTMLNNKGEGVFKGKNKLPGGMYFVFLPSRNLFDFLVSDNQQFAIEADTSDFYTSIKFIGDKQNQLFVDYSLFLENQRMVANKLTEEYKGSSDEKRKKEIEKKLNEINEAVAKKTDEIIAANPDMFFSKFLKATQDVKIPENITDQKDKYYYYRNNYFNYFNYKDERLLRTPIYENKLNYYVDKVLPQVPDSLIPEIDRLIDNSRHNKELFRYMLVHLFNKYAGSQIMGMENVYLHIAEKYYIKDADWSERKFLDELKENVRRKKQALIGKQAPEIKLLVMHKSNDALEDIQQAIADLTESGKTILKNDVTLKEKAKAHKRNNPSLTDSAAYAQILISDLAAKLEDILIPKFDGYISLTEQKAKYLIMYFWEPDCSHCKEAVPKFSAAYDEKNMKSKGVEVMAVYLHRNINEWDKYTKSLKEWAEFIKKHNMLKWINAWEPFGYSQFRDKYDISSSPVLYLLDKDKKIIAKKINWDQAFELIDHLEGIKQ
jgi:thiol-disulfide isomerase/thioredoxin